MLKLRNQYMKDTCEEAILINIRAGACVRQSSEVLQADLVYTVRVKDEVNSTTHAERQEGEHTLIVKGGAETNDIVRGKELFYGVKLSRDCIMIDQPTLALSER